MMYQNNITTEKQVYIAPQAVCYDVSQPLSLLSSLSLSGDIEDYLEGGIYEGEFTDPLQ